MDERVFQEFLARFSDASDLKAAIIDDSGFISASFRADQVGSFHEAAYRILQGSPGSAECIPDEEVPGKPPVFYTPLERNGQLVGLLELTGEEQQTRIYARVMKLAIESMLQHEVSAVRLQKYNTKFDLFVQKLIYDPQASRSELEARASRLGFLYDCMRIPVFITTDTIRDFSELVQQGSDNPHYHTQDIMTLSRSGNVTLFVYLGYGEDVLRSYREYLEDYLKWWREAMTAAGCRYQMHIGSIQSNLLYYRSAYDHAVWLNNTARCEADMNWFYDYTEPFLKSSIPVMEFKEIFDVFAENLPTDFLDSYKKLLDSLILCDFNLLPASKRLYVHKNTLSFRLGKIRDRLNINLMQDPKQREFASNFCLYLKMLLP